ncbi:hypothetical protein HYV44_02470 [Candidatus Microgenomates bacterium]|nr:hypothetical protein [Candidatus Microgenomates bacterium]
MHCEICDQDIGQTLVFLPIKRIDGKLNTSACLSCAEQSGYYCQEHQRPYIGFNDGTSACLRCIEKMVTEAPKDNAASLWRKLTKNLPAAELKKVIAAAQTSSDLTKDSLTTSLLRFLASKACRERVSLEKIISHLLERKDANLILDGISFYPKNN